MTHLPPPQKQVPHRGEPGRPRTARAPAAGRQTPGPTSAAGRPMKSPCAPTAARGRPCPVARACWWPSGGRPHRVSLLGATLGSTPSSWPRSPPAPGPPSMANWPWPMQRRHWARAGAPAPRPAYRLGARRAARCSWRPGAARCGSSCTCSMTGVLPRPWCSAEAAGYEAWCSRWMPYQRQLRPRTARAFRLPPAGLVNPAGLQARRQLLQPGPERPVWTACCTSPTLDDISWPQSITRPAGSSRRAAPRADGVPGRVGGRQGPHVSNHGGRTPTRPRPPSPPRPAWQAGRAGTRAGGTASGGGTDAQAMAALAPGRAGGVARHLGPGERGRRAWPVLRLLRDEPGGRHGPSTGCNPGRGQRHCTAGGHGPCPGLELGNHRPNLARTKIGITQHRFSAVGLRNDFAGYYSRYATNSVFIIPSRFSTASRHLFIAP